MMPCETADAVDIAIRIGRALESLGIPYFLVGSLASSVQGDPRTTNDIDMVVDMSPSQVAAFAQALGPDFDVDEEALTDAVRKRSSWNIFFLPAMFKVDLFQIKRGELERSELSRCSSLEVNPGERLLVISPEDCVLRKLLWYRQGGEVSSQQWRDIVGLLRINASRLDRAYMARWAKELDLEPLLARATSEASLADPR